jgi:hypothetical protein
MSGRRCDTVQPRAWILALVAVALLAVCANASVPITKPELAMAGARVESAFAFASSPEAPATPSGSSPLASRSPKATFPSEVAGLPVLGVADTVELLQSGQLDGQAVAVAGYYGDFQPSCPYPGRYIGPLETWCSVSVLTGSRTSAQLCHSVGANGMSCGEPSGVYLAPFFENETSGDPWSWETGGPSGEPPAFVLIGHAGDARQWQCTAATQTACARAFVVDRIAWANGNDVPLVALPTTTQLSDKPITPTMTLAQIAAALGLGDDLLAGTAFRKGDIASVDPRWNFVGDDVVWLVRSLGPIDVAGTGQTRPETVWLVDDASGQVIDSHPLQLAADYQPARLWQMATVHGRQCCNGDTFAFDGVESGGGTPVFDGLVPGGESGSSESDATTFGGSYGSGPLVLPAGDYTVTAWLASYDHDAVGLPRRECKTLVTLLPLQDVVLNADYPHNRACTFQPAPSPSPVP